MPWTLWSFHRSNSWTTICHLRVNGQEDKKLLNLASKTEVLQRNAAALLSFAFFFLGWTPYIFQSSSEDRAHPEACWWLRGDTGSRSCGPGRRGLMCHLEQLCELDGTWSCSAGTETSCTACSVWCNQAGECSEQPGLALLPRFRLFLYQWLLGKENNHGEGAAG